MTVKELIEKGYTWGDQMYERGYVKRTNFDVYAQEVHLAGGSRKGQYYCLEPTKHTSQYCIRQYFVKKVEE